MRSRLAKLASTSAKLRAGIEKRAVLISGIGKAIGGAIAKKPVTAATIAAFGGLGAAGAVSTAKDTKNKFNPGYQQARLGLPPTPPGT